MSDLLRFLGESVSPYTYGQAFDHWKELLLSGDALVWLFIVGFLRYNVASFCVWIVNIVNPRAFRTPQGEEPFLPMVSVVIAGRNPGVGILRAIRSVLDSGYPRVEVIYADDHSTDDSVQLARTFERTGRVRVFATVAHSGKPSNLNVALWLARGDLAFIMDSDAEIEFGTIYNLVQYFRDHAVGGVAADIRVRNASANMLTRLQEIEYALNGSIGRLWRANVGLLPILPGAASMIRMSALRRLNGFDTGLGDDTDMTLRMRKTRWKLCYALDARLWTDEPHTLPALLHQRIRWARNMVKVRLRKHPDLVMPRFGWDNTLLFVDNLIFRVALPIWATIAILWGLFEHPSERAFLITGLYGLTVFLVTCKTLIANDVARTPPLFDLFLVPLYLPYRFMLRTVEAFAIAREYLRIGLYHPYVPKRIWAETPHW
jgi:biofilm PGA synthesis N-glycosyltransferase PgaC